MLAFFLGQIVAIGVINHEDRQRDRLFVGTCLFVCFVSFGVCLGAKMETL